jgi:ribonuclease BN (tRNA processing enzyme)
MSGIGVLALGVGDAFSARSYSSCLAVEADGAWLLIDCPHPIRKILREAGAAVGRSLDLDAISGVAITHLHADHSSGLEGLGFYCRFVLGRRMPLLAHPLVMSRLWDAHLAAGMQYADLGGDAGVVERRLEDFFDWVPLDESRPTPFGAFRVRCRRTHHSVPTTALIVHGGEATFGYSADTTFDPGLIDWLLEAELVVHEAGGSLSHTPYERLRELPAPVRDRLRLIHCADGFDPRSSEIEALRQGGYYHVGGARAGATSSAPRAALEP